MAVAGVRWERVYGAPKQGGYRHGDVLESFCDTLIPRDVGEGRGRVCHIWYVMAMATVHFSKGLGVED